MKNFTNIIISLVIIMVISGCASKPPVTSVIQTVEKDRPSTRGLPDWFLNPPSAEDAYYGVGSAKMSNLERSRKRAESSARNELATTVETKVAYMIKDYAQESGAGDHPGVVDFVEIISKQVANQALAGSKHVKSDVGPDGTVYRLYTYPLKSVIDNSIAAARKEEALYNEFKARQGFEALEKELRSMDTSATPE